MNGIREVSSASSTTTRSTNPILTSVGTSSYHTSFTMNASTGGGNHFPTSTESIIGMNSSPATTALPPERQLSVAYTASEAVVSLLAIFGNTLVVYVFCTNRSLRRYRNYYIFALAIADFLVGLFGIPFAVLASVGLPRNLYGCLFTVSILMVLCTISILCLVAVSIDRYWATTNPFAYYRHMTTSTAVGIILSCWIVGAIIGFLPLFGWYNLEGWYNDPREYCYFTDVIDYNYLVFLYFATIVFPAILMAGFYGYIYHVVLIKIRQKGNLAPQIRRPSEQSRTGSLNSDQRGASQLLRIIVSEKRREAKAAHKLGIIVLFFMICWMPLYTINCIQAFCPRCQVPIELLNFTIILSHANSSLNPLLYAYHLKEFRIAMKNALLMLFSKVSCGWYHMNREQKDPLAGPLSRSQTMPSLAHTATIAGSAAKVSMKFHRSPRHQAEQSRSVQISPRKGCMIMSSPSRENLYHTTATDKSLTSLSLASNNSNQTAHEIHDHTILPKVNNENPHNKVEFVRVTLSEPDESSGNDSKNVREVYEPVMNGKAKKRLQDGQMDDEDDHENTSGSHSELRVITTEELESKRVSNNQLTTPL